MPDPRLTRPDLCSTPAADAEAEPAGAVRAGLSADRHPPSGDDPPAPSPRGTDRAIRLSTAAAVLAVAAIAAYVSYGHAYAIVRAHGETGITAQLEKDHDRRPGLRQLDAGGAVRRPAPDAGTLPRPLAARAGHRRYPHGEPGTGWSHGPAGAVVALAGGESSWARTNFWSGSSAPAGRQTAGRRQRTPATVRPAVLRRVPSRPQLLTASTHRERARHARTGVAAGGSGRRALAPSPPADSVTLRR